MAELCKENNSQKSEKAWLLPVIWLFLLSVIIWPKFYFSNEVIAPLDLLSHYYPWRSLYDHSFVKIFIRSDVLDQQLADNKSLIEFISSKRLPLWNPFEGNGRPFATLIFKGFLNPVLTLSLALLNPIEALSFSIVLRLVAAGLFMFLYLREIEADRTSSLIGATVFALSGFNTVWLSWSQTLVSCFAPLLFLGTERLITRKKFSLLIVAAAACMNFAGFPSVAGYFFYLSAAYYLFRSIQFSPNIEAWLKLSIKFGLSIILGITVTAVQLVPSIEFLHYIDLDFRRSLSSLHLPIKSAIQLVAPSYWGNSAFHNWQGAFNFNEASGYTGFYSMISLFIFTLVSVKTLANRSTKKQRTSIGFFFCGCSILSLLVIYNIGPFLEIFSVLPVFNVNRNIRLFSVFSLSQAVITSLVISNLEPIARQFKSKKNRIIGFLIISLLTAVFMTTVINLIQHLPQAKQSSPYVFTDLRFLRLAGLAWILMQSLAASAIIIGLSLKKNLTQAAKLLILLITTADLVIFGFNQNPTADPNLAYPITPGIKYIRQNLQPSQRLASFNNLFLFSGTLKYYQINTAFTHNFSPTAQRKMLLTIDPQGFEDPLTFNPDINRSNLLSPAFDLLNIRLLALPPKQFISSHQITQQRHSSIVGPISNETNVSQSFTTNEGEYLHSICFLAATYQKELSGKAEVSISKQHRIIASKKFSLEEIDDNSWQCISLDDVLLTTNGQLFINISTNKQLANPFTIYHSTLDTYPGGQLFINNQPQAGDLAFKINLIDKNLKNNYQLVYQGEDMNVYQNVDLDDLAFFSRKPVDDNYFNYEDFYHQFLIDNGKQTKQTKCAKPAAVVKSYGLNSVSYEINSDCTLYLVAPELWYPGWKLTKNDQPADILNAFGFLRGAVVNPGKNKLKFTYQPLSLKIGAAVSAASFAAILLLVFENFKGDS